MFGAESQPITDTDKQRLNNRVVINEDLKRMIVLIKLYIEKLFAPNRLVLRCMEMEKPNLRME